MNWLTRRRSPDPAQNLAALIGAYADALGRYGDRPGPPQRGAGAGAGEVQFGLTMTSPLDKSPVILWIPISDRLPAPWVRVLVFVREGQHVSPDFVIAELVVETRDEEGPRYGYWSADNFYHPIDDGTVTHWAELIGPDGEREP